MIAVAGSDDADGDGLPDYWEEKYGVDDPEGDDDEDGLTNIEEYELRTKPDMADSDEDGLSDKDEIEVHETNPLKPDATVTVSSMERKLLPERTLIIGNRTVTESVTSMRFRMELIR